MTIEEKPKQVPEQDPDFLWGIPKSDEPKEEDNEKHSDN